MVSDSIPILDYAAGQDTSSTDGIPTTAESVLPEEHSPQLKNNMAIVDDYLPTRSPACKIENLQHASLAPERSPTYARASKLATPPEAATGPSSSFL